MDKLSFGQRETTLNVNGVICEVKRYYLFIEEKLYHINCPKIKSIIVNRQRKSLPEKIYMTNQDVVIRNNFHKKIEEEFNI